MLNYLSLGGGVQSTALFLMSLFGFIKPRLDAAIFADTGWERDQTYYNVESLRSFGEIHGVPVHTVMFQNIYEVGISGKYNMLPVYAEDSKGKARKMHRVCTDRYKIKPVNRMMKSIANGELFETWIGFSVDEAHRMRNTPGIRYPLIDNRIGRDGCAEWLMANNFPVPVKSSCIGCPLHSNATWMQLNEKELEGVFAFEEGLSPLQFKKEGAVPNGAKPYLHRSLVPMRERPFERGVGQTGLFDSEHDACDDGNCFT